MGWWSDDPGEGVSSVVGTVLMLGITLAVFAAFALAVFARFSEEAQPVRADLAAVSSENRVLLQHRGGDPIPLADADVLATVNGATVRLPMTTFAAQTGDGATWRIGETICLAGPVSASCHFHAGQSISEVFVVSGNSLVLQGLDVGATSSTSGSSSSSSSGSSSSSSSSSSTSSSSTGPSCTSGTVTLNANAVVSTGSGWAGGTSAYASDNAYATNADNSPGGLRLGLQDPSTLCTITAVRVRIEQSITNFDNDKWSVAVCLSTCMEVGSAQAGSGSDSELTFTATSSRPGLGSWQASDMNGLEVIVTPAKANQQDGTWRLDRVYAEVVAA